MPDITVRNIVVDYLRALQERGDTRLPVDESARQLLTNWFKAAKIGRSCEQTYGLAPEDSTVTVAEKKPEAPRSAQEKASAVITSILPTGVRSITEAILKQEEEEKKKMEQNQPDSLPTYSLEVPEGTVEEKLRFLYKQAAKWAPALELDSLRKTMVFAIGNPHADIMLIGEAPGYHEENQREPFVGPAGEKLNQIFKAMGLSRQDLYISNIVKFRPAMPKQTTNNRQPTDLEIATCLPLIMEEIKAIRPKVIIALGGTAAQGLLKIQSSVSSLRGKFHEVLGIPLRVTYHPSYLLRSENNRDKRLVWEDMLSVMEFLNMPISEKQQRYFRPKA